MLRLVKIWDVENVPSMLLYQLLYDYYFVHILAMLDQFYHFSGLSQSQSFAF